MLFRSLRHDLWTHVETESLGPWVGPEQVEHLTKVKLAEALDDEFVRSAHPHARDVPQLRVIPGRQFGAITAYGLTYFQCRLWMR